MTTGNLRDRSKVRNLLQPGKLYRTKTFLDAYENGFVSVKLSPGIVLMFVDHCPCDAGESNQGKVYTDFRFLFEESRMTMCTGKGQSASYIMANLEGPL